MSVVGNELKAGDADKTVYALISHAMAIHNENWGCTFRRSPKEIADEVFEFLVAKVEEAEDSCRPHTAAGFGEVVQETTNRTFSTLLLSF